MIGFQIKRTVLLGVKSLWLHKLRAFLTVLGIVFGVGIDNGIVLICLKGLFPSSFTAHQQPDPRQRRFAEFFELQ